MKSRFFAVALIIIGAVLLIFGVNAWQSVSSEISQVFSGTPNVKSIILICAGVLSIVFGSSFLCKCK